MNKHEFGTKNNEIQVGRTYTQDGDDLHIIALHEGQALIEKHHRDGEVLMYIVTSRLFLDDDGDLHWRGNGEYFLFGYVDGRTAHDAFCEAWTFFSGRDHGYVLTADTDQGAWTEVYKTRALAMAGLQVSLDLNDDIQHGAKALGLLPLSAESYLLHSSDFLEVDVVDCYTIDKTPILDKAPTTPAASR